MGTPEQGAANKVAAHEALPADWLRVILFLIHATIIGYVASGWLQQSRTALFAYVLILPLIVMQWIFNGGSSIVSNIETLQRTGRWRDPNNGLEGAFFQLVLRSIGINASTAQINTVVLASMFMFWMVAMFRMVLIVPTL